MFVKLKHSAVWALIMCFLAQPVWAAGEAVTGTDPWVNSGVIEEQNNPITGPATAEGVSISAGFANTATNAMTGEIIANATSNAPSGGFSYGATSIAIRAMAENIAIINEGTLTSIATAADEENANAYGMWLFEDGANISNSGTINALSLGDTASSIGIHGINVSGAINNDGVISVYSEASGIGMFSTASSLGIGGVDGDIVTGGTVSVTSVAMAGGSAGTIGIKSDGPSGDIVNNGIITLMSDSIEFATGVGVDATLGGVVYNTDTILVHARSGDGSDAVGVEAIFGLTNTGTIRVFAETLNDPLAARAAGVNSWGMTGPITTSGDIIVGSTSQALGFDLSGTGSVANTGAVKVAGDPVEGIYGMFLRQGTWSVANLGTIQGYTATDVTDESTWTVTNAFRTLRVGQDAFSTPASATLTSDFQVILDGDPDGPTYLAPIFVADGSSLDLNSQNLVATPGANVVLNRGYQIIENEGTVIGTFGGLVAGNPAIRTDWTGTDNGENAEVTFEYQPATPPAPAQVAVTMADTATDQLRQFAIGNALRGTEIAPEGPTAIVRPWAGNLSRGKKDGVGYNAGMAGVLAGVEVPVTADLVAGGHVVAGGANVDYTGTGYSQNSEDQTMFGLGAHGRWTPGDWYLDGMLTSYMVNHDYSGRTGLNLELDEDDEYESYGVEASLIGGHKFRHDNITAMPFAGLGYSWINTPGHETKTATGTWQTKYGSLDQHNVRAIVGARVSAEYAAFDGTITPSLGLRYEHSLTDNDIRIRQSLQGASEAVKGERADGSMIVDAGISYGRGPLALELGGSIEKNDDYDAQSGFIGVRWTF